MLGNCARLLNGVAADCDVAVIGVSFHGMGIYGRYQYFGQDCGCEHQADRQTSIAPVATPTGRRMAHRIHSCRVSTIYHFLAGANASNR
jgi:hypothetical protein